jgi:hypothetical protein
MRIPAEERGTGTAKRSSHVTPDMHRQISFEHCCKAQLLLDSALGRHPDGSGALHPSVVPVGDAEVEHSKAEMGMPETGWFSMSPYIEDMEWESKGDHLL